MKKIISLILVLIMICTALASCSDDGVPKDMTDATVSGEPFILYVPQNFTVNTSSGISSAYLIASEKSVVVTARYFTPSSEMTLAEYVNKCIESYIAHVEGFDAASLKTADDMLAEKKAIRLEYTVTTELEYTKNEGEEVCYVVQRFVEWNGDFVSLNFYATAEALETYSEQLSKITENFTLTEKGDRSNAVVTDKNTPEGMKIASPELVEYCLYVPTEWVCDPNREITEAHHPETLANVTVTAFSPSGVLTAKEYVDYSVDKFSDTINGYEELDRHPRDGKIDGVEAEEITFLAKYDGVSYKIRQVSFVSKRSNLCYSITYTATEADFDTHLADFEKMLGAFDLR